MRPSLAPVLVGLLAWLPACRNQAFESCTGQSAATCGGEPAAPSPAANSKSSEVSEQPVATVSVPNPPREPGVAPSSGAPSPTPSHTGLPGAAEDDGGAAFENGATFDPAQADTAQIDSAQIDSAQIDTAQIDSASPSPITGQPAATSDEAGPSTAPAFAYGDSMIANGDFAEGSRYWSVERVSGGGVMPDFSDEALCVTARGDARVVVGWPKDERDSLTLPSGRYQFSFKARGRGVHVWAKVGHAYEPYTVLFEREWTAEQAGWHDVVYEFEHGGAEGVGVAFNIDFNSGGDRLCLEEVALRRAQGAAGAP